MTTQPKDLTQRNDSLAIFLVLAWLLLLVGLGFAVLYSVPSVQLANRFTVMLASFIPYGTIAWAGALVIFVFAGRGRVKLFSIFAAAGLALQLSWLLPYFPTPMNSGQAPTPDETFSVMTLNSRCNGNYRENVADTLWDLSPDIAVIQGNNESQRQLLSDGGLADVYPHSVSFPMSALTTCGTTVYSKTALARVEGSAPAVVTTVQGHKINLLPVDVPGPQEGTEDWASAIHALGEFAATQEGSTIVVGDYNAVREHYPMRELLRRTQLTYATDHLGWLPTWQANISLGPFIQIDHVLISDELASIDASAFQVGYSAHRALLVELRHG